MSRPPCCRRVGASPPCVLFKPAGVPCRGLEQVVLTVDELESLRLADLEGLYQSQAAARMNVSQPTFARIVASARKKVAAALSQGRALRIEGGVFQMDDLRQFVCDECAKQWGVPRGTGRPSACPDCGSTSFRRADGDGGCAGRGGRGRRGLGRGRCHRGGRGMRRGVAVSQSVEPTDKGGEQ